MLDLLILAGKYSAFEQRGKRTFVLGAVGLRTDGRLVHSRNESVLDTYSRNDRSSFSVYKRFPESHAEARLTKKLGFGATVYVARVNMSKEFAMARPCVCCRGILQGYRVHKVYYTINNNEWGCWDPETDIDTNHK